MIIYIYSQCSRKATKRNIEKIEKALKDKYNDIKFYSYDEIDTINKEEVDTIFISGGDGTIHNVINCFKDYLDKITFGFFPAGTANDISKNNKIKSFKDALSIINMGIIKEDNLFEVNDELFYYALSVGEMSRVSIDTSERSKKRSGKLIYKLKGIKYLFKKRSKVIIDGKEEKIKVIIILRTLYLGGTKIGKSIDNKLHIYKIKNIFDLVSLFIFNRFRKIEKNSIDSLTIESNSVWCVDGEKIDINKGTIKESSKKIKMLSKNA